MKKIESLLLGILIASGALIIELTISIINPRIIALDSSAPILAILIIAIIEELFKLAIIWKISQNYKSKIDIFINSVFIGIGFSSIEIFLNIFQSSNFNFSSIVPYFGLLLIHTTTCAMLGYYFSFKKYYTLIEIFPVMLITVITHFLYNLTVAYDFNPIASYIALFSIVFLLLFLAIRNNKSQI